MTTADTTPEPTPLWVAHGDPFRIGPRRTWHRWTPVEGDRTGQAECSSRIRPEGDEVQWGVETPRSNRCSVCFEFEILRDRVTTARDEEE